jgi:hypothetical protein
MKRIVPLLALVIGAAVTAEAATTTTSKSTTKSTTAAKTPSTASSAKTAPKSTATAPATKAAPKAQAAPKTDRAPQPESDSGARLGFRAIGGSLGFVDPEGADGTMLLGVFADMGRITPRIALEPRIDYWSKSEESFGARASVRDVIVGARAKYLFETSNPKLQPFAGAGLALHFLHSEVSVPVPPGFPAINADDSATKLGLDIGGGVSTPLGLRSDLMGELWYGIVSDVSQLSLRVGVSYRLQ